MAHLRSTLSGREAKDILIQTGLRTQRLRAWLCGVDVRTVRRWEAKDEPLPLPVSNLIHLAKGLTLPPNVTPLAFLPEGPRPKG